MNIAIFGGSFDPVHLEHAAYMRAAIEGLGLDRLFAVPSYLSPHKRGAAASGEDRLNMCRIAVREIPRAEVSDIELNLRGTSYTYITCRLFREKFPSAHIFFLVGADMLADFFHWKDPDSILNDVGLVACGRAESASDSLHARFRERFHKDYLDLAFTGENVSSTQIRTQLAFGKRAAIDGGVADYIAEHGLYSYPVIAPALALEKEERREHSFRVALTAVSRARSLGIAEEKALLAAALHDCAKSVPLSSPLLSGFCPPEDVPPPVLHQFTGAYIAEHTFGITDEEILDAIRYHTSGREDMTALGKLIFLSDMLEPERSFEGIDSLRRLFETDLDECLYACLKQQTEYLAAAGKPVYPLTSRAYRWIKERLKK